MRTIADDFDAVKAALKLPIELLRARVLHAA